MRDEKGEVEIQEVKISSRIEITGVKEHEK